jgi:hypothetical protein
MTDAAAESLSLVPIPLPFIPLPSDNQGVTASSEIRGHIPLVAAHFGVNRNSVPKAAVRFGTAGAGEMG